MKINQKGIDLIKRFEGLELKAYKCSANKWTIGYGHTSAAGDPKVTPNMTITADEAESILSRDLVKYEGYVNDTVKVSLSENEFSALVSLVYNIGPAGFARSSVVKFLNAGNRAKAADAFLLWNKGGGKVLKGLVNRREAERALFLSNSELSVVGTKVNKKGTNMLKYLIPKSLSWWAGTLSVVLGFAMMFSDWAQLSSLAEILNQVNGGNDPSPSGLILTGLAVIGLRAKLNSQ